MPKVPEDLGWTRTPTMAIGQGSEYICGRAGELPGGRLIVAISKHVVAVIDGVIHDIRRSVARRHPLCLLL
jgi:hypothetical protein